MGEVEELVARLLTSTTPNAIVPPEEPKKPFCGIAFVGIAPGEQEVIQGRPLVGPSGRIFDACLKAVGIDRESCWIGNLCPVRLNRDRGLSFHEVSILREPLLVAMEELQPQVIVTLGAEPTRAFFVEKDVEITLMRSHVLKSPALLADAKIVPTIHPAYILRQNLGLGALLLNDFMIAKKLLTGEPRYRPWDYHVISSLDELRELLFTHRGELMSLDTEATSENPFQAWPFIISFAFESSPDLGYVIHCPTRRYHPRMGPETLLDGSKSPTPIEDVLEEFKRANPRVVIQNMMYDYILLTRLGYSPEVYVDTMYAFSLLDENCPRNLSTLGSFFCGIGPYSTDYRSTDLHTWIPYAACDAVNTIRLWQALEPRFLDPRLRHLLFDYIMPLIYELSRMSLRGIWINRERLKDVGDVIQKEIDEKIRTMQVIAGMEFNPRSNDQLAVVFDKLNIPILGRTSKTRKPSFKKELLQKLEDRYPFVKLLLETKHLSKIHSSYIKNLHKYVDEHDVVHPIFDIKKTGRLSAVEPAVQTLPRDSVILELFTARPGHIFIKADFSAAELR
ncbi:MAG: DNA polymerase, partial [Candidatus Methanomethylicaceae archaeon]